ncbi:MAG: DUF366 family protein [Planctomycetota bacterium]
MKTRWLDEPQPYDGAQLAAHWIRWHTGLEGDAMVAFRGPCAVARDEIADLEDLDGPGIAADDMVHFLWESFTQPDLLLAVHRQRLLTAQALEVLQEQRRPGGPPVRRCGDDLWCDDGKLSISIATATPVSSMIHFAVNAQRGGAPVAIAALADLGVDPAAFAAALLTRCADEQDGIAAARAKVRAKGEWRR